MAPVVTALSAYAPDIETRVVLTGQHTTLVDQVLTAFDLRSDHDLGIMKDGQTLYDVVHETLDGLRDIVQKLRPDVMLVQGDTATVFAASLVGFFERVRVGHVEAGLRSGDKRAPFPEEVLRRLTDVISDYYFAPTGRSRDLLLAENVPADRIHVTGNTVVDALTRVAALNRPIDNGVLRAAVEDDAKRLVLLTAHRRESFGEPMRELFGAVRTLADEFEDITVVYPVHPNPNVKGPAHEILSGHPRISLTEPLDYFDLVGALQSASLVLTDSGGIQEEAPTFGAHVLVLREVTERPEGVDAGVAELVGTDAQKILDRARVALTSSSGGTTANPYGDGKACARIADIIVADLTGAARTTADWTG
jgi:UDP-N-acetylglucosamine 2-epimerase (non-hydrolysing)